MLRIPAVYRFEVSTWGFNKLTEVCEAGNNRFRAKGRPDMTPRHFLQSFIHSTLSRERDHTMSPEDERTTMVIVRSGDTPREENLCSSQVVELSETNIGQIFVPAGWGREVLKAIDKGAESCCLVPVGDGKILDVFVDRYGESIQNEK